MDNCLLTLKEEIISQSTTEQETQKILLMTYWTIFKNVSTRESVFLKQLLLKYNNTFKVAI